MHKRSASNLGIAIVGDGGWGTTIAIHLAKKGFSPVLWGPFPEYLSQIEAARENVKFLPGFALSPRIKFDSDLMRVCENASVIFLAVPSVFFRRTIQKIKTLKTSGKCFVILSKGIEASSHQLMSQILEGELGPKSVVAVSGPCISREIAQGIPTAVVAASKSAADRKKVREILSTPEFTVLESSDVIGVQLGGSLKNVLAIAAGMLDGMGYGSNTKSVLLARGMAEMTRLARKMKADPATFLGLSGLGDLVTTSFSIHSRNHSCGVEVGKGASLKQVLGKTEMVVEGAETAKSAYFWAKKHRVQVPIIEAVYQILFLQKPSKSLIDAIMHKGIISELS